MKAADKRKSIEKMIQKISVRPISRLDADDSRLLKKEMLRLVRTRTSIIRTLFDSDQEALELARIGECQKDIGLESDIEALIWKYVALNIESKLNKENTNANQHSSRAGSSAETS